MNSSIEPLAYPGAQARIVNVAPWQNAPWWLFLNIVTPSRCRMRQHGSQYVIPRQHIAQCAHAKEARYRATLGTYKGR